LIQPLTATTANVEAAQMELEEEKPNIEELRAILNDIDRDDHRASTFSPGCASFPSDAR
jgi:hypothetical protein